MKIKFLLAILAQALLVTGAAASDSVEVIPTYQKMSNQTIYLMAIEEAIAKAENEGLSTEWLDMRLDALDQVLLRTQKNSQDFFDAYLDLFPVNPVSLMSQDVGKAAASCKVEKFTSTVGFKFSISKAVSVDRVESSATPDSPKDCDYEVRFDGKISAVSSVSVFAACLKLKGNLAIRSTGTDKKAVLVGNGRFWACSTIAGNPGSKVFLWTMIGLK